MNLLINQNKHPDQTLGTTIKQSDLNNRGLTKQTQVMDSVGRQSPDPSQVDTLQMSKMGLHPGVTMNLISGAEFNRSSALDESGARVIGHSMSPLGTTNGEYLKTQQMMSRLDDPVQEVDETIRGQKADF